MIEFQKALGSAASTAGESSTEKLLRAMLLQAFHSERFTGCAVANWEGCATLSH